MTCQINYVGMFDRDGKELPVADGYHADEYLPGYDEQTFDTEIQVPRWVESNHKGPDVDGVEARFVAGPAMADRHFSVGETIEAETTDLDGSATTQTGRVIEIDGADVTVAWDDGQRTTQHFSLLQEG